jgi:hypothetical protein
VFTYFSDREIDVDFGGWESDSYNGRKIEIASIEMI